MLRLKQKLAVVYALKLKTKRLKLQLYILCRFKFSSSTQVSGARVKIHICKTNYLLMGLQVTTQMVCSTTIIMTPNLRLKDGKGKQSKKKKIFISYLRLTVMVNFKATPLIICVLIFFYVTEKSMIYFSTNYNAMG